LGPEDAQIFNFYYDVSEEGNFEEKNILNVRYAPAEAAKALKIDEEKLNEVLERGREKLFAEREKRIKPFRDEKVLTAWNGLMMAAFAEASAVLDEPEYLAIAKKNAEFILTELQSDGRLLRTWKNGKAKLNAYLEDHANVADALIELYQVSGEIRYLYQAKRLVDVMIDEFWDEENGGFYFTASGHEQLIVRNKDYYDNATPSGNSVGADVLLKLSKFFADEKYERFAATVLRLVATQISRYPQGFGRSLSALELYLGGSKEIIIVGEKGNELARAAGQAYIPDAIVVRSENPEGDALPLLEGRTTIDGKPTAYVCENFVCQRPVTEVEKFLSQI